MAKGTKLARAAAGLRNLIRPSDANAPSTAPGAVREVFLVASEVLVGKYKISTPVHKYIAARKGLSVAAVSHWGVVVVDHASGVGTQYDLMSEAAPVNRLRQRAVTGELRGDWTHVRFVGRTDRTDAEIEGIGRSLAHESPIYDIVYANCQHFAKDLLRELCNVEIVDEKTVEEELQMLVPDLAMFVSLTSHFWNVVSQVGRDQAHYVQNLQKAYKEARI